MVALKAGLIAEIVGGELLGNPESVAYSVTTDSRKAEKDALFIALKGENFNGEDFLKDLEGRASVAISTKKEDVSYSLIIVKDTLEALTALSSYYINKIAPPKFVVSLTGSVGKTTTKEMTASVLEEKYKTKRTLGNLNNHIGVPLTLLSFDKEDEVLVVEMGMSHKGEISHLASLVNSDVAMITNIGHSHIENLGSRENIRDAKLEITEGLKEEGTLIINGDEPLLKDLSVSSLTVGFGEDLDLWADSVEMFEDHLSYKLHVNSESYDIELPCVGRHNVTNSLFAVAVGLISGISIDDIRKGLLNYRSIGLRQKIYKKCGVTVIADCYNAGLESMKASLSMLSELNEGSRKIAVLGDMLELGGVSKSAHETVGKAAYDCGVNLLLTYGNESEKTHETAKRLGVDAYHFHDKDELTKKLTSEMKEGDTLLFKGSRGMKLEEIIATAGLEN